MGKQFTLSASDAHKLDAYRADPAGTPKGGIVVIQEIFGVNQHIRAVCDAFAKEGYAAVAPALFDRTQRHFESGYTPAEIEKARAFIAKPDWDAMLRDTDAAIKELQPVGPVGIVGFCMGGGLVWRLLAAGTPALAAAVPFYGPAPDDPDFGGSREAAVLAFYGALDQRVNATEPVVRGALEKAAMVHEVITEPDANHAFFNDTGDRYNPVAAADAWHRVQDWFAAHLA